MAEKRLFLLDAFALIFRGYYALIKNPRINSKGMDTSAILGFTNSLLDVIRREKPDHLAVAFDKGGSHLRTEAFEDYKAHRQETPEAIKIAVPYIQELLKAMHIPIIEVEGYEADDLIGTISKQAEKKGYKTYMVTPDKDFAQLVSENIFMYRPARMGNGIEIWGIEEVQKKFEVERPEQVIDYLAMMGDSADNIPGLPGVGDKTAKKFLKAYGSIEGLFEHTHELKGKMKEKVEANQELGLLSKKLATILLDCPVSFNEEDFQLSTPDFEKVTALFTELEFRRTADTFSRLFQTINTQKEEKPEVPTQEVGGNAQLDLFSQPAVQEEEKDFEGFYQYINTPFSRRMLLSYLLQQKEVGVSLGIDKKTNETIGISFSYEIDKGYYLALPKTEKTVILQSFKPFFENENIVKVGVDIKQLYKELSQFGIHLKGGFFDISLAHYLLQPDMRHQVEVLSETYLKHKLPSLEKIVGSSRTIKDFQSVELSELATYFTAFADVSLQLQKIFLKELKGNNLEDLYQKIELPLLAVLADMELEGISLDSVFLETLSKELTTDIDSLQQKIYDEAGTIFNIASPKQLGEVLFDRLKLVAKPKKTRTGQYATGEEILSKLAPKHSIVQYILDWRGFVKLQNTYVDALPNEVNKDTQRIHTTFSQIVAATGRLSSLNPNLQNIPIRTERGRQVRKAFVPRDENYTLLSADYSQIELRIIASLSKDETMIEAFKNGQDIHTATASKIFDIPVEEVTREQRGEAKAVNFGIIYGQGATALSAQLNKTRTEAKKLIDSYYETFPKLKTFIATQIELGRQKGYVETILGRRRYLKNINSQNGMVRSADERNAVNAPIQGSAADIIKIAMIRIQERLKYEDFRSKMLLQVHDELIFDVCNSEMETIKELIRFEMENAFGLEVPLVVDMGVGQNWLEAH